MDTDQLKQLAGDARVAASAAHRAHRDGSLALGREAQHVLAALDVAATALAALAGELDTAATEAASSPDQRKRDVTCT